MNTQKQKTGLQLPQKFVNRLFFGAKRTESQSPSTPLRKGKIDAATQTSDELLDELLFEKLKKAYMAR